MLHGLELGRRAVGQGLNIVSTWMQTNVIRSVQAGTINLAGAATNTATINVVNVNNTILFFGGVQGSGTASGALNTVGITITLTNGTTVTATRIGTDAAAMTVHFFVLEFPPGVIRSVQRFGSVDIAASGTGKTQAITAVNVNKTILVYLGMAQNDGGTYGAVTQTTTSITLTSSILVTVNIGANIGASTPTSFDVIEFY